jgi:hypothetical protein
MTDVASRFLEDGYIELPVPFDATEEVALSQEVRRAFSSCATSELSVENPQWLVGLDKTVPVSRRLAIDSGQLWDLAEHILGGLAFPCPPELGHLIGSTPWHFDDPIGVRGVKFVIYLAPIDYDAELRVLKRSHVAELSDQVKETARNFGKTAIRHTFASSCRVVQGAFPRMIALDLHVWHEFAGSKERYLWCPEYVAMPRDDEEEFATREKLRCVASLDTPELLAGTTTIWQDFLANLSTERSQVAARRLNTLGAFDFGE